MRGRNSLRALRREVAIMPVLAEQAVQRTTCVEHGEVVRPVPVTSRAHPISDTVRRQRVAIPVQDAPLRGSGQMNEPVIANRAQPTVAALLVTDLAFSRAQGALHAGRCSRRGGGQMESTPRFGVHEAGDRKRPAGVGPDALTAQSQTVADQPRSAAAERANVITRAQSDTSPVDSFPDWKYIGDGCPIKRRGTRPWYGNGF